MERTLSSASYSCPACDETSIKKLGLLRKICGLIPLPFPGYLYRCNSCALLFRRPYIPESDLERVYSECPSDFWADTNGRSDFELAGDLIRRLCPKGSILEIGCFRGDFLAGLPDAYQKYGIELSKSAREVAQQRGIELVGTSISNIDINYPTFHAIILMDVFEHLPRPMDSLRKVAKLLLPGGIIIISTGNTDALIWRLMRLDYWYYFTEHVSFFNLRWFRWAGIQLDLKIVTVEKFAHPKGPTAKGWYPFFRCLAFCIWKNAGLHPRLQKYISYYYPFNRVSRWPRPPETISWKDHMLVVLKSKVGGS